MSSPTKSNTQQSRHPQNNPSCPYPYTPPSSPGPAVPDRPPKEDYFADSPPSKSKPQSLSQGGGAPQPANMAGNGRVVAPEIRIDVAGPPPAPPKVPLSPQIGAQNSQATANHHQAPPPPKRRSSIGRAEEARNNGIGVHAVPGGPAPVPPPPPKDMPGHRQTSSNESNQSNPRNPRRRDTDPHKSSNSSVGTSGPPPPLPARQSLEEGRSSGSDAERRARHEARERERQQHGHREHRGRQDSRAQPREKHGETREQREIRRQRDIERKEREMSREFDRQQVQRRNKNKPPLRLLSLDGGGIRGFSTLLILEQLMFQVFVATHGRAPKQGEKPPKPCEVFDLIGGTGTGGLIALMLGRLRMDIAQCKKDYIRLTKYVFETDKRIAGIPYGKTLFKASKLEDAIKDCVRDCTVKPNGSGVAAVKLVDEGDWRDEDDDKELEMLSEFGNRSSSNKLSKTNSIGARSPSRLTQQSNFSTSSLNNRPGDANTKLYDPRRGRCKTFVTAVYKGSSPTAPPSLLRTYNSPAESAPEPSTTIWQAGRATSAVMTAFKPIQIGQNIYLDEGSGKYNPAPYVLEEACQHLWPGRDVGAFVSIGTGKRSHSEPKALWWEGVIASPLDDFVAARRRLLVKLEDAEDVHQSMISDELRSYDVLREDYYRLNVEVGVGEFGLNEWSRIPEISTSTHVYLGQTDVNHWIRECAQKMGDVARVRRRMRESRTMSPPRHRPSKQSAFPTSTYAIPAAIELPADIPTPSATGGFPSAYDSHSRKPLPSQKYINEQQGYVDSPQAHRQEFRIDYNYEPEKEAVAAPPAPMTPPKSAGRGVGVPDIRITPPTVKHNKEGRAIEGRP